MAEYESRSIAQAGYKPCKGSRIQKEYGLENEDILNAGFEQVKSMVFEAMARERPDLYKDVAKYLEEKRNDTV